MSRFRFRVLDTYSKTYYYKSSDVDTYISLEGEVVDLEGDGTVYRPAKGLYILEQSTGMADTNGMEIWEGDVLQLGGTSERAFRRVVGYRHGTFGWLDLSGRWMPIGIPIGNSKTAVSWEVVGNIHENPELVGEPK